MTSWLKAAEVLECKGDLVKADVVMKLDPDNDLLAVVDRRAKLVVSDLGDEISENNLPGSSNGQGSQRAKRKSKRLSLNKVPKTISLNAHEQIKKQTSQPDAISTTSDNERDVPALDLRRTTSNNLLSQSTNELEIGFDKEISVTGDSLTNELPFKTMKNDSDVTRDLASFTVEEPVTLNSNAEHASDDPPPVPLPETNVIVENEVHQVQADFVHKTDLGDADYPLPNIDQDKLLSLSEPVSNKIDPQSESFDIKPEPVSDKHEEPSSSPSPSKVQDQLEEAQGLLKITKTTGQSKEARLARVCTGLSTRLQEYKSENAQLEELLVAERELSKSYVARIKQLQKELSVTKMEVTRVESHMGEALAAKNHEIEALSSSLDSIKKQSALSEGNLASLQTNMESIMRNRELTETRIIQALREELAIAERRVEEERSAHNATKKAAMEREVDLEQRSVDASMALSRIQRLADDRTSKAADLEQKVALLEVECASLNQELQDMEARVRRGQKKSPEDANQVVQAWQDEVERARQGQRDAESKLSGLEADVQKLRVEMAAMKRDAEHYSRQEHMDLEKRYRELTDLLYYKQTQLESMASEKAAAEFQLEKEIKRGQDTKIEEERMRASRRTSPSWDEDTELKALEPHPLHHRHMVGANMQLQKAAKFLDRGAVRATRFLWRYPTARLIMLFYLVFVHLFLMFLLHHLQEQADQFSSREVAESMGLNVSKLP